MLLKKKELLICLHARGYGNIMGFDEPLPEMNEKTRQSIKEHLMDQKLLEQAPQGQTGYRFSDYAQVILDTIGRPDASVEVHHLQTGIKRGLFLKNAFYICVEEIEENVSIDLLPSLPIFIGGYASMLKDLPTGDTADSSEQHNPLVKVCVSSLEKRLEMEIDQQGVSKETEGDNVSYRQHTQESCTNAITMWLLTALRQMKEKSK